MKNTFEGWVIIHKRSSILIFGHSFRRLRNQAIEDFTQNSAFRWKWFVKNGAQAVKATVTIELQEDENIKNTGKNMLVILDKK